jgi:hypothetical protein
MKYALVDNNKVEAAKGLKGICPICHESVIPRCGQMKIHHWAHKRQTHCDKWWENETEWHRNWKNLFPVEWQEVVAFDNETGEKHIADIKTNYDFVVEFQHSFITEEERVSRENFYKKMAWVVDGTRRKRDYKKFLDAFNFKDIRLVPKSTIFLLEYGYNYLPNEWLNSRYPVFFDFKGLLNVSSDDFKRNSLWCLLPIRGQNINVLICFQRANFVNSIKKGGILFNYDEIVKVVNKMI